MISEPSTAPAVLTLGDTFQLVDGSGAEVKIRERRGRALVAILAQSEGFKRSRAWLRAVLWPEVDEEQSASSLRQLTFALRKTMGPLLQSDRSYVWLTDLEVQTSAGRTFFADAPHLGDAFEDWLRGERNALGGPDPQILALSGVQRPCLVIAPAVVLAQDMRANVMASLLLEQIVTSCRAHDAVDIFDLRDQSSDQISAFPASLGTTADGLLKLAITQIGTIFQLGLQIVDPNTMKVVWQTTYGADQSNAFEADYHALLAFSGQAVDSIHMALHRREANETVPLCLLGATHQLMTHSPSGKETAVRMLRTMEDSSAVAQAWLAYSYAILHGENFGVLDSAALEEAQRHCRKAVEMDPSNPLVRGIAAHVKSFVLRQFDSAAEDLDVARRNGANLAIAWHASAVHAIYTGNEAKASDFAKKAFQINRFSPYKPIFDSSMMLASALNGDYRNAIHVANDILARHGKFLPAMRYLSTCLAMDGQIEAARRVTALVRTKDPDFRYSRVASPRYPLPAKRSIELVQHAFRLMGDVK